jgi:hypothetical protein
VTLWELSEDKWCRYEKFWKETHTLVLDKPHMRGDGNSDLCFEQLEKKVAMTLCEAIPLTVDDPGVCCEGLTEYREPGQQQVVPRETFPFWPRKEGVF